MPNAIPGHVGLFARGDSDEGGTLKGGVLQPVLNTQHGDQLPQEVIDFPKRGFGAPLSHLHRRGRRGGVEFFLGGGQSVIGRG